MPRNLRVEGSYKYAFGYEYGISSRHTSGSDHPGWQLSVSLSAVTPIRGDAWPH